MLFRSYYEGKGVAQDFAEALKRYRAAADAGNALAQARIGQMYAAGKGVAQDFAAAMASYRKAIEQGIPDAYHGIGDLYAKIKALPDRERAAIEADIAAEYTVRPPLAMVDSSKGITNLHVPSDVIIDASMPAAIRSSGQMWNADDAQQDTKFVIPDSSYAPLYAETVDF